MNELKQRFDDSYIPEPNSGCWLWISSVDSYGYGMIRIGEGKRPRAHRLSYELFVGPIPEGLCVLHKCDVPGCVNPDRLFLGTNADNVADRDKKGRGRWSCGEDRVNAKLTEQQAMEIKCSPKSISHTVLSRQYGIAFQTVSCIRAGTKWKHLS